MKSRSNQAYIYKKAYTAFFKLCIRYCGSTEIAKEVFNDAMLGYFSYEENTKINEQGRFSLIRKIIVNKCIDHLRLQKVNIVEFEEDQGSSTENLGDMNLMREEMFDTIKSFPPRTRLIFNMYVFEGWSHKEIADELNISIHTSSWHVNQGKNQILNLFKVAN